MSERKICECNEDTYEKRFIKKGIERLGLFCKECHQLLDYYPQYNED